MESAVAPDSGRGRGGLNWRPLLVAVASDAEARLLPPNDIAVRIVRIGPGRGRVSLGAESPPGKPSGLLSFGFAGGLDRSLRPGTILLPRRIHQQPGVFQSVNAVWHARVAAALISCVLPPSSADLLSADDVIHSGANKRRLYRETGAGAVDMESSALAHAAARWQVPFLVMRVVLDGALDDLPPGTIRMVSPDGRTRPGATLLACARSPFALMRLLFRYRTAAAALRHSVCRAWPALLDPPQDSMLEKHGGVFASQAQ